MSRFTLKDLLLGTAIVAIGLTLLAIAPSVAAPRELGTMKAIQAGMIGGGSMTIGSGLAYPFKRPWLGWLIGSILMWPAVLAIM